MALVRIHPNVSLPMSLWHVLLPYLNGDLLSTRQDSMYHMIHNQMILSSNLCNFLHIVTTVTLATMPEIGRIQTF